VTYGRSK